MKKIKLSLLSFVIIIVISIFGIFFIGLLAHEFTHIVQSNKPISVCYDFQQLTFMHVKHNITIENICKFDYYNDKELCNKTKVNETKLWDDFVTYTEKWAYIVQLGLYILLGLILGIIVGMKLEDIF